VRGIWGCLARPTQRIPLTNRSETAWPGAGRDDGNEADAAQPSADGAAANGTSTYAASANGAAPNGTSAAANGTSAAANGTSAAANGTSAAAAGIAPTAAGAAPPAASRLDRTIWAVTGVLRQHRVLALVLTAGIALRVLAQIGYQPALLYIDTNKYIFGTDFRVNHFGAFDPLGYTLLLLRPVLMFANLGVVALLQHVLGLAMAAVLYVLMLRRGVVRWLAALAVAPVLLDAYQLNAEQTIMPDVLFQALVVAGLVVLLWQPRPGLALVVIGGLLLGTSAPVRQVGEALILPALVYVVAAARGGRTRLLHGAVLTACFAAPILGYMAYSDTVLHYGFELSNMGDAYLYGRTAHAADCATLNIPAAMRPLCPAPQIAAPLGVDGLVNSTESPRVTYMPVNAQIGQFIDTVPMQRELAYDVIRQQPLRVVGDIAKDAVKVFAVTRDGDEGDTAIARWQFQTSYPYYPRGITQSGPNSATSVFAATGGGGDARVFRPAALALRDYQLHGSYTPGPVLLIALLAGVAGICTVRRRRDPGDLGLACLLVTVSAVAVLLGADLYEFSWRYQLPALVTLPVAGALGATAIARRVRERRATAAAVSLGPVGELEQVS
jgi:hypothetical protein